MTEHDVADIAPTTRVLPHGCERPPRPMEELKQIALDLLAGKIFTDRHLKEPDLMRSIFMPLMFFDADSVTRMIQDCDGDLIFEYIDQAGPRGVNGYPSFFSMQTATVTECAIIDAFMQKLREAADSVHI